MTDFALLVPLTPEAREALGGQDHVAIDTLPFRIGRESRMAMVGGKLTYMERRKGDTPPNNDLYLVDNGELLNISREHLQIEKTRDGEIRVHDRGSACGTRVGDAAIGGNDRTGSLAITEDSEIVIGTRESPYRFRIENLERLQDIDMP